MLALEIVRNSDYISDKAQHRILIQVIALNNKIMRRIRRHGRGHWVFSPKDFLDLGSRAAVDQALSRLAKAGQIRRICRGLYDMPRISRALRGPVPANVDNAVAAIARRDRLRVMPDGIVAASQLGLTSAVPAKADYLIDGAARTLTVGGRTVRLKHVNRNLITWANRPAGPVVNALLWLGPAAASDPDTVAHLRRRLPDRIKRDLVSGVAHLPAWAASVVHQVGRPDAAVA
jgi:hypothetical protein